MALPALEKTWEFRTNFGFPGNSTELVHEALMFYMKQLLTDTIANGYQNGTFVDIGGGNFEIQGITDDVLDGSMVGKTLKVRGSTSAGNDGDFVITAIPTPDSVRYANGSGVDAEGVNGSWSVLGGNFTIPWEMQHSQRIGTVGVKDDEVDRWGVLSDVHIDIASSSYTVLRNSVTGTEWAITGDSNSGGNDHYGRKLGCTYPNSFLPGAGGSGSFPSGNTVVNVTGSRASHREYHGEASAWFMGNSGAAVVKLHLAMSDDGQNTRLIACSEGFINLFWFDETVKNPHPDWISGGNATVTSMFGTGAASNRATYGTYNDGANCNGSTFPATGVSSALDHHMPDLYMSAEGYGTATIGENLSVANELTGEYSLFPIGLISPELGHRGRVGQIPDMWYCPTGLTAGMTIPDNTSRQFLVLEDIVIPWDGSLPEIS